MLLRLPARGAKLPRTFLRFNSTALAHQPAPPPAPSPQRKWPPRGTRPTALSTPESPHPPNHHILIAHKDDLVLDDSVVAAQAEPIVLSDEQESLIELLLSGKNVFFTGKAGTGKTEVLRQFVERARGLGKRVAVTSATGIAASHIDGMTLHSFLTLSGRTTSKYDLLDAVRGSPIRSAKFLETDVLVIDEISMVHPELFDTLEYVSRLTRQKTGPFGRMQVVFCGDFHQLPPVTRDRDLEHLPEDAPLPPTFVFESATWKVMRRMENLKLVELKQIFRQRDPKFIAVLDRVRQGVYDRFVRNTLGPCWNRKWDDEDILPPTIITGYRARALRHNQYRLDALPGKEHIYHAVDTFGPDQRWTAWKGANKYHQIFACMNPSQKYIKEDTYFTIPSVVPLKKDAQVVLMRNIAVEKGLVNGARGTVVGFDHAHCNALNEKAILPIVHFPALRATYRIGYQTWEYLPFGVARTPGMERYYSSKGRSRPPTATVTRTQIPLTLAWALTVHKSQGMTLDRVTIDLSSAFAAGQAYTALSRARSLDGLSIWGLTGRSVFSDERVLEFGRHLEEETVGLDQQ